MQGYRSGLVALCSVVVFDSDEPDPIFGPVDTDQFAVMRAEIVRYQLELLWQSLEKPQRQSRARGGNIANGAVKDTDTTIYEDLGGFKDMSPGCKTLLRVNLPNS